MIRYEMRKRLANKGTRSRRYNGANLGRTLSITSGI